MANLILVCTRQPTDSGLLGDVVRRCAAMLSPDNIRPHEPLVFERDRLAVAVANPVPGIPVHDGAVCLGRMFGPQEHWWVPGSSAPDGSYAMARHDAHAVELVTDILATRQVWYVRTDDLFMAATSQRALVALLGSFDLNRDAVTWMLTSGHLGGVSWDRRLHGLPADCRVALDRRTWKIRVEQRPAIREPALLSNREHIEHLRDAILETCAALDLPMEEWLLPLSGGLDSRMLLLGLLSAGAKPRCVTWGLEASLSDPRNDACIARELADRLGVSFQYCPTDGSDESLDVSMRRFVQLSEGQTTDYGGYADGMAMWKAFFENGVAGVIRGDEPGLWADWRTDSAIQIRREVEMTFLSDYPDGHPIRGLGLAEQRWNEHSRRRPEESIVRWTQRLLEEFYSPAVLAPLTTIKCAYVEVVNPLQSSRVVRIVRELPDHLLVDRTPLAAVVRALGPDVPLAKHDAHPKTNACPRPSFAAALSAILSAESAESVLSRPALDTIVSGISGTPDAESTAPLWRHAVRAVVPKRLASRIRPVWPLRLSSQDLALRASVAVQMADILESDARTLNTTGIV
jgi:hypothetical protein